MIWEWHLLFKGPFVSNFVIWMVGICSVCSVALMMNMNTIKMVMFERLGLWSVQKPHGAQNKIVLAGAQSLTMKSMPLMTSLVALHPKTCLMGHLKKPQSYQEKNPGRGAQKLVSINQVQLKTNSIKWSKMIMLYWLCRQQCKNSEKTTLVHHN